MDLISNSHDPKIKVKRSKNSKARNTIQNCELAL